MIFKTTFLNFMPVGVGVASAVGGTVFIAKGGSKFVGGSTASTAQPTFSDDEFTVPNSQQNHVNTDLETTIAEAQAEIARQEQLAKEQKQNLNKELLELPPPSRSGRSFKSWSKGSNSR